MSAGHTLHPSIIREYDIRGVFGETLSTGDAEVIGRTYASMVAEHVGRAPRIATARDGRLSSPELHAALCKGMQSAGATVLNVGVGPTPMCYFAVYHLDADAGVMLTGSHNPKAHNGMKFMLGRAPFYGEQVRELGRRAAAAEWASGEGSEEQFDVKADYVDALLKACRIAADAGLNIVWDAGNGAAGEICDLLAAKLTGCKSSVLFGAIDGNFPNHHPDPSVSKNLEDLVKEVKVSDAKLGLAFDGDGDRLGAVDDMGRMIASDHLLMLFAGAVLDDTPGATIIADVKTSQMVFDSVAERDGNPIMWMTGHSHIKNKMKETGAAFAGEASGHLFFADRYYGFDDGLYAALRLIELTARLDEPLSTVIDRLPTAHSTPELRIDVPEERKFTIIDEIRARLDAEGADYLAIDGVRMMMPEGWWLIRASNTQAAIIARAESATPEGLQKLTDILIHQLEASDVTTSALAA